MYKISGNGIQKLTDGAFIPADEHNYDYQVYLQWVGDGNTPQPEHTLAERRELQIIKIKEDATAQILDILPEVKQRNSLARSLELTRKVVLGSTLTAQENAEIAAIEAKWDEIKAIRLLSNNKEAEINAGNEPELITL